MFYFFQFFVLLRVLLFSIFSAYLWSTLFNFSCTFIFYFARFVVHLYVLFFQFIVLLHVLLFSIFCAYLCSILFQSFVHLYVLFRSIFCAPLCFIFFNFSCSFRFYFFLFFVLLPSLKLRPVSYEFV